MLRLLLILFALLSALQSREITDMAGRTVTLDAPLEKVFGSAPPTGYLVALYRPDILVGLNIPVDSAMNRGSGVLDPQLAALPILRGWHGTAGGSSAETLLAHGTQAIIAWNNPFLGGMIEKSLQGADIPLIYIDPDDPAKLPETFRFLGSLFAMEARGEALARYAEEVNAKMAALRGRVEAPKRVYYALGPKGLMSECDNSFHATFIEEAGGVNVNHCRQSSLVGLEAVSFESLLQWQPDVILVQDPVFYKAIFTDAKWKLLTAVKNRAVLYVPKSPINWLDRPPSFMRLLGAPWLASKLYPEQYKSAFEAEAQRFFALFFGYELSAEALKRMERP